MEQETTPGGGVTIEDVNDQEGDGDDDDPDAATIVIGDDPSETREYDCGECESQIAYLDRECPECENSLQWAGVAA
jgi:lipopolysaccharide biosynthesis regulator YciM